MSQSRFWIALICLSLMVPAANADLTKNPRSIAKEPAYQTQAPKYCLLVFGPEAKTRIWLVLDGNALYVDRNGNSDLTEKGEQHAGTKYQRLIEWKLGPIVEADGKTRHSDLRVRLERGFFILSLRTADGLQQEVGNEVGELRFSDRAPDAPVVHLAGPLTFLLRTPPEFIPGKAAHFLALIGTAGLGEGSATYSHVADFGRHKMTVEVEFPKRASAVPERVRGVQTDY